MRPEDGDGVRRSREAGGLADADEIDRQRRRRQIEIEIGAGELAAMAGERATDADRPAQIVADASEAEHFARRLVHRAFDADLAGDGAGGAKILDPVDGKP